MSDALLVDGFGARRGLAAGAVAQPSSGAGALAGVMRGRPNMTRRLLAALFVLAQGGLTFVR